MTLLLKIVRCPTGHDNLRFWKFFQFFRAESLIHVSHLCEIVRLALATVLFAQGVRACSSFPSSLSIRFSLCESIRSLWIRTVQFLATCFNNFSPLLSWFLSQCQGSPRPNCPCTSGRRNTIHKWFADSISLQMNSIDGFFARVDVEVCVSSFCFEAALLEYGRGYISVICSVWRSRGRDFLGKCVARASTLLLIFTPVKEKRKKKKKKKRKNKMGKHPHAYHNLS